MSDILSEVGTMCREALAVEGIFQLLGVGPDDLYMQVAKVADGYFPIIVAPARRCAWAVEKYGRAATQAELLGLWREAVAAWNTLPLESRKKIVDESNSRRYVVEFLAKCSAKGVHFHG